MSAFDVEIIPGEFAILKLELEHKPPGFIFDGIFFTILRSSTELSVVCDETVIPDNFACVKMDKHWSLMRLAGPFDFDQTGVLADFLRPLANAQIGILAVSSFDTDYILVKTKNLRKAISALEEQNYICSKS